MSNVRVGAIAAAMILISGCGKEATGQTVAVVNGEEISQAELNAELAATNVPQGADTKKVLPQLLQRVVDRRLLAQAAIEEGLDRNPEYVSRQRRATEDLLIGMSMKRRGDSIKLPSQAEIDKFIAENSSLFQQRSILSLNQIVFDPPSDMKLLDQLKNDHSLEAVSATLQRLRIPFSRAQSNLDTGTLPAAVAKQIAALPPGEPFVVPANGKIVVSVITGREAVGTSAEQSRKQAAELIKRQKLEDIMQNRLKELKSAAEISYQEGFAPTASSKVASPKNPK